jgi:hypothetical protein
MPSSPGYKRDYKQEWSSAKKRGEDTDNAMRHRARYKLEKEGKVKPNDGKDVGHLTAVKRGGTNSDSNLQVQSAAANRSFARNKDGSMKSETSKKERK